MVFIKLRTVFIKENKLKKHLRNKPSSVKIIYLLYTFIKWFIFCFQFKKNRSITKNSIFLCQHIFLFLFWQKEKYLFIYWIKFNSKNLKLTFIQSFPFLLLKSISKSNVFFISLLSAVLPKCWLCQFKNH